MDFSVSDLEAKPAPKSKEEYILGEKKYSCSECGQRFVSERAMNIHESTMHDGKNRNAIK